MTLFSAVFASSARLRFALRDLKDTYEPLKDFYWCLKRIAGRVADVATLQVALELGLTVPEMMRGAACAGSVVKLDFLEAIWGSSTQHALPSDLCAHAASSGSVEALRWVEERDLSHADIALLQAAKFGHVNLLDHIYSDSCELTDDLLPEAAQHGSLGAVKWLFEHDAPYEAETICGDAAESGNLELVQFVINKGGEINESTMRDAALRGHLALCQHLHSEQCPWDEDAVTWAGSEGHTEVIRWLVDNGCPYDAADVCIEAAENDHLDVIQYMMQLEQLSAEHLRGPLNAAAANSHLDVAERLLQQGAYWPALLQYEGHYWTPEAVVWARSKGCTSPLW
jgi:hypothetical protein